MTINVYGQRINGRPFEFRFKGHELIHGHQFEKDGMILKIKPSMREGCDADFHIYEEGKLMGYVPFKIQPWAEIAEITL